MPTPEVITGDLLANANVGVTILNRTAKTINFWVMIQIIKLIKLNYYQ